jgi:hypothetical protein
VKSSLKICCHKRQFAPKYLGIDVVATPEKLKSIALLIKEVSRENMFLILHTVTCRGDYRRGSDWMIGFIAPCTPTQFRTTGNYSAIAIMHTFQFTVAHTHYSSQSSLVVSGKRIYNCLTVTSNHTLNFLCAILIPFLPFLLNHLRLPDCHLQNCVRSSLYSLGADSTENTVFCC